ncbi:hypothetical protein BCR44DRAFT_1205312 [Catenaria anguillulae PL171]|uniref:Uncharacterized protein n=1 Tax=Catenaria anguillulae PL171 TaxID=765915 RepID=A0A1Y2HF44_9FUNG|nr:hypothetical protein BCR44DRAFT_1205312 [Catenaria anguillulae PL171]
MGTSVTASSSSASAGSGTSHHTAPPRPGGSSSESVSINQLFSKFKSAGRSSSATPTSASSAATPSSSAATTSASSADAGHGGSSRSGPSSSFKTATLASKPSLANRTRSSPLLGTRPNSASSTNSSSSPSPWSRAVSQSSSSHSASGASASGGRAGGPGGPKSIHAPRPIQLPSRLYEQQHSGEVHKAKITLTRTSSSKSVIATTAPPPTDEASASKESSSSGPGPSGDAASSAPNASASTSSSAASATPAGPTAWSHVAARASGVPAKSSTNPSKMPPIDLAHPAHDRNLRPTANGRLPDTQTTTLMHHHLYTLTIISNQTAASNRKMHVWVPHLLWATSTVNRAGGIMTSSLATQTSITGHRRRHTTHMLGMATVATADFAPRRTTGRNSASTVGHTHITMTVTMNGGTARW